jgi:predicted ester cyclase
LVTGKNAEGKDVNFTGLTIVKFKDGKLMEGWSAFDFLTMYQQLGFKLT